jgi:sulfite reductase subunit B
MKNPYLPNIAVIEKIKQETGTVKTFKLRFLDEKVQESFTFLPGQFVEVSVFGIGEAPISLCYSPFNKEFFEFSVRCVGNVTNALCRLSEGDTVGIRGPYGNGFPVGRFENKNVVMVGGGVGLPPIKSLIEFIIDKRKNFKELWLLYGAKDPADIVFKEEMKKWKEIENFNLLITVDKATPGWKGNVGVVTTLFDKTEIPAENTVGVTCGPPIMMKFVVQNFQKIGLKDDQMFLSMERLMQCGIGKCGHCNIGKKYVCQDGPIFTYEELKELTEKIW